MPSTRRSLSHPATPLSVSITPKPTSSRHTPRSASRTPSVQVHHHKTADELALEEAEEMLHSPLASSSRFSTVGTSSSAREARHRHLEQVRAEKEHDREDIDNAESEGDATQVEVAEVNDGRKRFNGGDSRTQEPDETTEGDEVEELAVPDNEEVNTASLSAQDRSSPETTSPPFREPRADDSDPTIGDSSSDSASSESDSEVETSSEDDDDSESDGSSETSDTDDSDEEDERMEALLQAAKTAAKAKQEQAHSRIEVAVAEELDGVLQFDGTEGETHKEKREAPIPDLSIPNLPAPHLSFIADGSAKAPTAAPKVPNAALRKSAEGLELDDRPYEKEPSKREKAAQPKKASASELWATIPAPRSDTLPQMKRDYQALSLANSLDPKRFMKGGNKAGKVPERFAIGTMVEQPRHMQDTTQQRERKYKPGQVVQGLVQDEVVGSYAKRKYGDLQYTRMDNGRGKGWKKRTKW
ncbi:Fcf2 pre-rRNA processing-domain-containing protein [Naematelia encephala]|uniref:Fcf2 pre-rRNA processing-domain-containing protein n=1 Tax=Naematelia encephala TaxID=71784 RepID=A0A1Y2B7T7_9TREE|nr:Fcf2 pre-rRNA processing-domain-containing protein [Naematelia encephala]